MTIVWVERLTAVTICSYLAGSLFAKRAIRYDENNSTAAARTMLAVLRKTALGQMVRPACLSMAEKDARGYALTYRHQANLDACLERFCAAHLPSADKRFKLMAKSYIASIIGKRAAFLTMALHRAAGMPDERHLFLVSGHPANHVLVDFYRDRGHVVAQRSGLLAYFSIAATPVYYIVTALIAKIRGVRPRGSVRGDRPALWIEYEGDDVMESVRLSFWRQHVEAKDFDIVYYFDRRDSRPSAKALAYFKSRGFEWIDLSRPSFTGLLSYRDIGCMIGRFFRRDSRQPLWFHLFLVRAHALFVVYRALFNRFRVKALIQHQELSWMQQIQVDALDAVGGIMIGFQWSAPPFCLESAHLTPPHVYLVWGKSIYEWAQKKGNTCCYILPVGMWLNHDDPVTAEQPDRSHNADFTITVFDSSAAYNIHQSPDTLSRFYSKLLQWLEKRPTWAAVVKSKEWGLDGLECLPEGKTIVAGLKSLAASGRLTVLSPFTSPATAAAYADLSVCYGLNSAGVVAGVHGYQAIHWDCSGWRDNPVAHDNNVVFSTLDELEAALVRASGGDRTVGDFSPWKQSFNYFEDFSAAKRAGEFIQDVMDMSNETKCAQEILDRAVKRYLERNKVGTEFFKN